MCVTKYWRNLESLEASGKIIAHRSDNLILEFYPIEFVDIYDFVERLETFRNCKCAPEASCSNHIEEKERINNARR